MKRLCFLLAGLLAAATLIATDAGAGKKDDTLVWATDRDNPIADPFYLNTRELVVIGHHVWDTLVIIDPEEHRDQAAAGHQVDLGQSDDAGVRAAQRRQVPLRQGDGCRRRGLHAEPCGRQGERHRQLRAAELDQERGSDRCGQGAHQPQPHVPAGARQPRRHRLHHAEGPLRQGAGEAGRQEGLRRRAGQRHRPLQDRRGEARRAHPDGEERRLLQGRLQGQAQHLQDHASAPSRTPTRAPPS